MSAPLPVTDAVRQVATASVQGSGLFADALSAADLGDWVRLDPDAATKIYIELEAALVAVRSIFVQTPSDVPSDLGQYLERAESRLEYALATISTDAGDQVMAHASRARSAQRQLAGLVALSDQILESLGRRVVADIAAVVGRSI